MSTLKRLSLLSPILSQIEEALPQFHHSIDTPSNRASYVSALRAWVTVTADILYNYGLSEEAIDVRISRLTYSCLNKLEPSLVLKSCKVAYDLLLDHISKKLVTTYDRFKDDLTTITGDNEITEALVAPVNRLITCVMQSECVYVRGIWKSPVIKEVEAIFAYFGFLIKLPLSNTTLENDALSDYQKMENNYPDFDYDNLYAKPLKRIITKWFKDFTYDGSLSRHGVGSVADAKPYQLDKFRNMRLDLRLEYPFKKYSQMGIFDYLPLGCHQERLSRCSKLVFVPKNVTKLRSISMEPASLQYAQQGVMRKLYRDFRTHYALRNHIKLEDQYQNQSLAYDGSITNKYATIDLSAASDTVSLEAVKYLFSDCTELYRWLMCTRSDFTLLPSGNKIKLKKFAPMGSAVCFPIETIIFAAIAQLACYIAHERGLTRSNETGIYNDFYSVYGDDIIVPLAAYDITVEILQSFNFKVNESKSYCDSPFKESCGGNYFCGRDITPIKWKVIFSSKGKIAAESYDAICSTINLLQKAKYRICRAYLIHTLTEAGLKPIFTNEEDKSPMLFSTHCTNFHLKRKYIKRYQKEVWEYDSTTVIHGNMDGSDSDCDCILYFQSLASPPARRLSNNMFVDQENHMLLTDVAQLKSRSSLLEMKNYGFRRGYAETF